MTRTKAITDAFCLQQRFAIATLTDVENRFGFVRIEEEQFFSEWCEELPNLTETDKENLDVLRRRYIYHRADGNLLEGTVMLLLVSPLLALAGFYDSPFRIKAEESVNLVVDDGEEVLRGTIDVLVLLSRLWIIVLESKKTSLSVFTALPQALAYLMANPNPNLPVYGIVTNGDDILFIKVVQEDTPQYDLSRVFAPFTSAKELYIVLQILKKFGQLVTATNL